jgi:hypothetical protein
MFHQKPGLVWKLNQDEVPNPGAQTPAEVKPPCEAFEACQERVTTEYGLGYVGIYWDILGYVPICWNTCETSDLDNCEHKFLKVVSNIVEVERTILNCHNLSSGSMSLSFFRRRSSKSFIVRLAASNWPEMGHVPT